MKDEALHILEDRLAQAEVLTLALAIRENLESMDTEQVCQALNGVIALLDQARKAFDGLTTMAAGDNGSTAEQLQSNADGLRLGLQELDDEMKEARLLIRGLLRDHLTEAPVEKQT